MTTGIIISAILSLITLILTGLIIKSSREENANQLPFKFDEQVARAKLNYSYNARMKADLYPLLEKAGK